MNIFIAPNGFSDHHMVKLDVNTKRTSKSNYYWIFNAMLLQDSVFCENFKLFWNSWKLKKCSFENRSQCWDVGKVNRKMFCQNYTFHSSAMVRVTLTVLQRDIECLERQIVNNNETVQCDGLIKKREELGFLLHEQAKGHR